jgi:hypothetical protein
MLLKAELLALRDMLPADRSTRRPDGRTRAGEAASIIARAA